MQYPLTLTPMGCWTGVLVPKIPGQGWVFSFGQMATWTPQMYDLWTPLNKLMSMVFFLSSFSFNFEMLRVDPSHFDQFVPSLKMIVN